MSNKGKGLREEMGEGYLSLLDSVRHSFEQAAWGQEGSGNLPDDFYRWATPVEDAPKAMDTAELGGVETVAIGTPKRDNPPDHDWNEFKGWIEGRHEAMGECGIARGQERDGPELGD